MLRLFTVLFFLLSTAFWAHAESPPSGWSEAPSLLNSYHIAYAPYRALYVQPIAIRQGQQDLNFSSAGTSFFRMEVCVVTQAEPCEADGEGSGWNMLYQGPQSVQPKRWVSVPQTVGLHSVKLRYLRLAGRKQVSKFSLYVAPPAQRAFSDGEGNAMVMWEGDTAELDSPFLVVEGIDADNATGVNDYYFIGDFQNDLFKAGRERGADVLILNFKYGGRDMRLNADVVQSAVQYVNGIKTGSRKIDVAGVSMGGVVTRYALADMEANGLAHNVARFVSVDAPQQGAVLDADLLDWMEDPPLYASGFEPPANVTSVAGRQLLQYNPFDNASPTLHQQFYSELSTLNGDGYPHQTVENIGVSFGTGAPNPQTGAEWLEIAIDVAPNDHFYIETGSPEAGAGSLLPLDVSQVSGIENASIPVLAFVDVWAFLALSTVELSYQLERKAQPTFIPYDSALDRVNGTSKFDHEIDAEGLSEFHNRIPEEIVEPLLSRLGYPKPPLYVAIDGPTAVDAGETHT